MAQVYDVASISAQHQGTCDSVRIDILPAERMCLDGDTSWRIAEFADPAAVVASGGVEMRLISIECAHAVLRIHKCADCGAERRYGGAR